MEKTRALNATSAFIDDLGIEISELKKDRHRLREDMGKKDLLIQKVRSVIQFANQNWKQSA